MAHPALLTVLHSDLPQPAKRLFTAIYAHTNGTGTAVIPLADVCGLVGVQTSKLRAYRASLKAAGFCETEIRGGDLVCIIPPDPVKRATTARLEAPDPVKRATTARLDASDPVKRATTARSEAPDPVKRATTARSEAPDPVKRATTARSEAPDPVKRATTARSEAPDPVKRATTARLEAPDPVKRATTARLEAPGPPPDPPRVGRLINSTTRAKNPTHPMGEGGGEGGDVWAPYPNMPRSEPFPDNPMPSPAERRRTAALLADPEIGLLTASRLAELHGFWFCLAHALRFRRDLAAGTVTGAGVLGHRIKTGVLAPALESDDKTGAFFLKHVFDGSEAERLKQIYTPAGYEDVIEH